MTCLFILLTISFEKQFFKILMCPLYQLGFLVNFAFSVISKLCLTQVHKTFSLKSLIVFGFSVNYMTQMIRFRYMIELTFVYRMGYEKIFIFCIWIFNCSSTICWKNYPFPIELSLHICVKWIVMYMWATLGFLNAPLI